MAVERDEVKGRPDPDHARDDVQPPQEQVEPFPQVRVGEEASLVQPPVAGDCDQLDQPGLELLVARPLETLAQDRHDGRFRAALTNTTNRKPNFSS